jgi:hypothetical protein
LCEKNKPSLARDEQKKLPMDKLVRFRTYPRSGSKHKQINIDLQRLLADHHNDLASIPKERIWIAGILNGLLLDPNVPRKVIWDQVAAFPKQHVGSLPRWLYLDLLDLYLDLTKDKFVYPTKGLEEETRLPLLPVSLQQVKEELGRIERDHEEPAIRRFSHAFPVSFQPRWRIVNEKDHGWLISSLYASQIPQEEWSTRFEAKQENRAMDRTRCYRIPSEEKLAELLSLLRHKHLITPMEETQLRTQIRDAKVQEPVSLDCVQPKHAIQLSPNNGSLMVMGDACRPGRVPRRVWAKLAPKDFQVRGDPSQGMLYLYYDLRNVSPETVSMLLSLIQRILMDQGYLDFPQQIQLPKDFTP